MESQHLWQGTTTWTIRIRNSQRSPMYCKKHGHPPPPFDKYISETSFFSQISKILHIPPKGTIFWRIGRKVQKLREKHQNPPRWHTMNVPERYGRVRRREPNDGGGEWFPPCSQLLLDSEPSEMEETMERLITDSDWSPACSQFGTPEPRRAMDRALDWAYSLRHPRGVQSNAVCACID